MYNYGRNTAKEATFATFTPGMYRHLQSIHGFKVFSYVKCNPVLLAILQAHPFSSSFLKAYPDFIFQVSDFQASVQYSALGDNRLSVRIDSPEHQLEFIHAIRNHRDDIPGFGWSSDPIVISINKDYFIPVSSLTPVFIPTHRLL